MFQRQKNPTILRSTITLLLVSAAAMHELTPERLGMSCSMDGDVYCHSTESGSFLRCKSHELHVFQCPERLQFSAKKAMCDWPENADCDRVHRASGKLKAGRGELGTAYSAAYYGHFQRLFRAGRTSPNGCRIRGGLFVSNGGTDYDLVNALYAQGMEIASHSLSHRHPFTWWATATYEQYVQEAEGMRKKLASEARIPYHDIQGFRVPYLQVGGDNMYRALHDHNFTYDSSMFVKDSDRDLLWPFTLDVPVPKKFCQHRPCPSKPYPGLWEIPLQRWFSADGSSCPMPDGCSPSRDAEEDLKFFRSNFRRYYESNRAPFGLFLHAGWFKTEHHLEALDRFVDELLLLKDVYMVTPSQVISWMKNPTALDKIKSFTPWACELDDKLGKIGT